MQSVYKSYQSPVLCAVREGTRVCVLGICAISVCLECVPSAADAEQCVTGGRLSSGRPLGAGNACHQRCDERSVTVVQSCVNQLSVV